MMIQLFIPASYAPKLNLLARDAVKSARVVFVFFYSICALFFAPIVAAFDSDTALKKSQSVIGTVVPDYTFLNREGQPVRLSSYRGKPLLVSFIYTGCFQVCPTTTRALLNAMKAAQEGLGSKQFNVVSIGFNQPADSYQALKSFSIQHGIQYQNWEFLSPHSSIVPDLTRDFGFSYEATPAGFDHILQVTLLDSQGKVYRQIYGENYAGDMLGEPLKQLITGAPVAENVNIADVIERIRILCTVYDPVTGEYRVNNGLFLEIAGGLTFLLAMIWFFVAEWRLRKNAQRQT